MEITDAAQALKGLATTLNDEINGKKAQVEAINIAVDLLENRLQLENTELKTAKDRVTELEGHANP